MKKLWTGIPAFLGMLALILDSKTALIGAAEGIRLCIMTVIPCLFPFFFLSVLLTSSLYGISAPLRYIGKLTGLPRGCESIFLIGLLGGYPTGAQNVASLYENGLLSKHDAQRMLGFCSNAGPAFLFGIAARNFTQPVTGWILWLIHILSAIIVSIVLPGKSNQSLSIPEESAISMQEALKKCIKTMALVCGWILLFRILIAYLNRWFLWYFSDSVQIALNGMMELTIGCTALNRIEIEGLRFILCSGLIAFGGLCVTMQTASITEKVSLRTYFPGKIMQAAISIFLATLYQQIFWHQNLRLNVSLIFYAGLMLTIVLFTLFIRKKEKIYSIPALNGV